MGAAVQGESDHLLIQGSSCAPCLSITGHLCARAGDGIVFLGGLRALNERAKVMGPCCCCLRRADRHLMPSMC